MNTTPPCEICHFHHDKDEFMSFSVTHPVLQVSSNTTSSILEESYVDIGRKRKSSEKNDFDERRQKRRQEWLRKYERGSRKLSMTRDKSLVLCDNCANALEKKLRRQTDEICFYDPGVSGLRCDNAGENVLKAMREWCSERGTKLETTIPYTSYQNGIAEEER